MTTLDKAWNLGYNVCMINEMEKMMAIVDGKVVNVGDAVSFKCDIEQWGFITKINGDMLTLKAPYGSGFEGDYIGGEEYYVVEADRCWIE